MKQFKTFKSLLILSSSLSVVLVGAGITSALAGCKDKHDKTPAPKPTPTPTPTPPKPDPIKQTDLINSTLIIPDVLHHYDKKHPFRYQGLKSGEKTGGVSFDSKEAKALFIKGFFPKIPNDKIEFQVSTDLAFVPHTLQKVYCDYDFKTGGYSQIEFGILSK